MDTYPSGINELAENFLGLESRELNLTAESILVTMRVCEKVQRPLTLLTGQAGFHSLLSRSLSMAQEDEPKLKEFRIGQTGSLESLLTNFTVEEFDGCGKKLIIHFLGLLITFVGEELTMHILEDIWPLNSNL